MNDRETDGRQGDEDPRDEAWGPRDRNREDIPESGEGGPEGAGDSERSGAGDSEYVEQPTDEQFALENLLPDLGGGGEPADRTRGAGSDDSPAHGSGGGMGPGGERGAGGDEESPPRRRPVNAAPDEALDQPSGTGDQPADRGEQPSESEPGADRSEGASTTGQPDMTSAADATGQPTSGQPAAQGQDQASAGQPTADQPAGEQRAGDAGGAADSDRTERIGAVASGTTPSAPYQPVPVPGQPTRPAAEGDHEKPPRRPRIFLSFFLAAVLIIGSVAGASSATVLLYLGDIASDLRESSINVGGAIVPTSSGEPQTILLLGSDARTDGEDRPALADTSMLLRLDPSRDAISVMSIPRDLKVQIPGHGTNKFNAAYALGGPALTLRTIRRMTGGLDVNHVVNVDFVGFIRVIDEINCIFINVQRRYYHSNEGLPPDQQYAEIDIEPGYQKLCGEDALDYARYRHTDDDLVRAARQQEVIREARQRVPISKLIADRDRMIDIFTKYTRSDISDTGQMIELINLIIDARNANIQEVQFPGVAEEPEPGQAAYVIADPSDIRTAVKRFLGFEGTSGPRGTLERQGGRGRERGQSRRRAAQRKKQRQRQRRQEAPKPPSRDDDGLVDASQGGRDVAETLAADLGPALPVIYPKRLPAGTIYADEPRVYHLRDTDKETHGAYAVTLQLQPQGDYFNVQGIRGWPDPPILGAPHETIEMNDREYKVYLDGDRVRLVALQLGENSYWVSNSLLQTLTNEQMLGMARSFGMIVPDPRTRAERRAIRAAAAG